MEHRQTFSHSTEAEPDEIAAALYPQAQRANQSTGPSRLWLVLLVLCLPWLGACGPNFIIRHRSQVTRPIHVYVNWRFFCSVDPNQECRRDLKPGRYYFYAFVPGQANKRWASPEQPVPFSVDKRTVIDLHDPKPQKPSRHNVPAPQSANQPGQTPSPLARHNKPQMR